MTELGRILADKGYRSGEEIKEIERQAMEREMKLRELLWLHHGCPSEFLYGDDGELQCSNPKHDFPPFTDFRRDSPQLLEWKLGSEEIKKIIPRPASKLLEKEGKNANLGSGTQGVRS